MQVTEQDGTSKGLAVHEGTGSPDACAGVDDQCGCVAAVRQRQARGMSPVAEELATRGGCRTPGPHDVDADRAILAAVSLDGLASMDSQV